MEESYLYTDPEYNLVVMCLKIKKIHPTKGSTVVKVATI